MDYVFECTNDLYNIYFLCESSNLIYRKKKKYIYLYIFVQVNDVDDF